MDKAISERIKKLLALGANNENENEARAAMNKAAQLAADNGLSVSDMNIETGEVTSIDKTTLTVSHPRNKAWESRLMSTICLCFDLEVVLVGSGTPSARWYVFGTPTDLDMGLYYFKYCRMWILRSGKKQFSKVGDQKAYGIGAAGSLHTRLYGMFYEEKQKQESTDTKALVVVKKDAVKSAVTEEFPRTKKMHTSAKLSSKNAGALQKGRSDGQSMPLHRGNITA